MSPFSYRTERNGTNERCDDVRMYIVLVLSISLQWGDSMNIENAILIFESVTKGWDT